MNQVAPLIVTATLGTADQRRFDALRRAHYPAALNRVAAHLTLFQHLPPARGAELVRLLKSIAAGPAPWARVADIDALDRGVAFQVESPELLAMRAHVAEWFAPDLMPADRAVPRLHITVQNKATRAAARALLAQLRADFRPAPLTITGFAIQHYRDGPWEPMAQLRFRAPARGRY